ncbi:MAG: Ig-like domain-containing protein [Stagnimonas sp.]|nr:Ig-like domain-containing protein [Stagnimonas sp.]
MRKLGLGNVVLAATCAALVAACGGGNTVGSGGSSSGGTSSGGTSSGGTTVTVATLTLLASTPQLSSSASAVSDGVILTVILKDSSNNVVPGATVAFATPDSAEINVVNPAISDANGRVAATLTTGGDPQNRTITITASTGTGSSLVSASVPVQVVGTTLDISGPENTQFNVETEYTVLLTDSAGDAVVGTLVAVSTNAGNTATLVSNRTDSSGQALIKLKATQAETTLTVTALGMSTDKEISVSTDSFQITAPATDTEVNIGAARSISTRWFQGSTPVPDGTVVNFSATRGVLTAGTATTAGGIASVSISSAQAGLSSVVASSEALTKPSATIQLEFVAITPSQIEVQANPAVIATNQSSEISAIVRDVNDNLVKNATVEFSLSDSSSGTLSSATAVTNSQGLAKVTYSSSSASSGTQAVVVTGKVRSTTIDNDAQLTVGGEAVGITIGTGAEIEDKDTSTYRLPFTVLITDSSGNPVPNAPFRLSVLSLSFLKGKRGETDGESNITVECPNEDVDRNGLLTGSEDLNTNGQIDPGSVSSVPATTKINDDGAGQFFLTYPKDFGEFVRVRIVGVASVAGTDTTETREFVLPIAIEDAGSLNQNSPYGANALCNVFDPQ